MSEQDDPARDEEVVRRLEEELKKVKVGDLLVQTLYTVSSLGYSRLAGEGRDLEQVRLAIETLRAVVPLLSESVPEELVRDFNQMTANLQLAYAKAVSEQSPEDEP